MTLDSPYDIWPIKAFTDNYIWALINSQNQQFCVVDPGDADPVIAFAQSRNLNLSHILVTHHHFDHTGGLEQLHQTFNVQSYGPEGSAVQHHLREGDLLELSNFNTVFSLMATPGHTLDHLCYIDNVSVFCGDTLFAGGCGRLFEGTPEQMHTSLSKLKALPEHTAVYCTHEYTLANLQFALQVEPENSNLQQRYAEVKELRAQDQVTLPSNISQECATNPFFRCEEPSLIEGLQHYTDSPFDANDPIDVFRVLRQCKDQA